MNIQNRWHIFCSDRVKAIFSHIKTYEENAMAEMIFYSTPECRGSKRKRDHLESAGNMLYRKDLTSHNWTYEELLPFVRGRDPLDIMNSSAPEIQMGHIDPLLLTFEQAVTLLVKKPALIKGPLIRVDNLCIQGLQDRRLDRYLKEKSSGKNAATFKKKFSTVRRNTKRWKLHYTDHSELRYSFA